MPSATLLGFQKYRAASDKGTNSTSQQTAPSGHHTYAATALSPSPSGPALSPHAGPYARANSLQPTALNSYALASPTTTSMRRHY